MEYLQTWKGGIKGNPGSGKGVYLLMGRHFVVRCFNIDMQIRSVE